jgi:hypothetical protein
MVLALWIGRDLIRGGRLQRLSWTPREKGRLVALSLALVALQMPLLQASASRRPHGTGDGPKVHARGL